MNIYPIILLDKRIRKFAKQTLFFGHTLVTLVSHSHNLSQPLLLIIVTSRNNLPKCE